MIACHGRAGAALLLDTRSLARRQVPVPPSVRVVVCNTMVKHAHQSGEYNARRRDCEAGAALLALHAPSIRALRDATVEQLAAVRSEMPPRGTALPPRHHRTRGRGRGGRARRR